MRGVASWYIAAGNFIVGKFNEVDKPYSDGYRYLTDQFAENARSLLFFLSRVVSLTHSHDVEHSAFEGTHEKSIIEFILTIHPDRLHPSQLRHRTIRASPNYRLVRLRSKLEC